MDYIRNKNLGFTKEQVVVFPTMRNAEAINKVQVIMEAFQQNSNVAHVTTSSHTPGIRPFFRPLYYSPESGNEYISIASLWTNQDFAKTYQLEFAAGRDFSKEMSTDATSAFIVNETAVNMCKWVSPEDAIGRQISCDNKTGEIIGVVKDFHFLSMHSEIEPMILHYDKTRFYSISARIKTDRIASTLSTMKKQWKGILPHVPCNYFFLDDQYDKQYRADQKVGSFLRHFTVLAIFISCLGLFGLASYTAEQRTKEIGIRKVLGAPVSKIVIMLSKEFTKWVLIANIIAWPIAYFSMSKWFQDFVYRTKINPLNFVLAALLVLIIAVLTVSYQSVKAALTNPVDSLKYE